MRTLTMIIFCLFSIATFGQTKKTDTIKIKTSAECEMCKKSIEKALSFETGVKKATLDVETKEVTVIYKPSKTNPDKIREAIANCGYDADDKPANNKAYQKLEDCCKKGAHSEKK